MVKSCCALNCRSSSSRDFKLSFHKFPRNPTRKRLWLKALKKVNWEPTPNTYVCSKHFTEDCYDKKRPEIRLLTKTAVPFLFGPNSSPVKKTKEKESKKNKDESIVRPLVVHIKSSDIDENGITDIHDDILRMKETLPCDTSPITSKADDNSETFSEDDDESLQTLVSGGSDFREIMKKVPPEKKKSLHSKLYEPEESDDKEILQFKLLAVLDILKQKDKQIRELKEKNRLLLKSNQSM